MSKAWYQIDRHDLPDGLPNFDYGMVRATSAKQALVEHLQEMGLIPADDAGEVTVGDAADDDFPSVTIKREKIGGAWLTVARAPATTSAYWTATKVPG